MSLSHGTQSQLSKSININEIELFYVLKKNGEIGFTIFISNLFNELLPIKFIKESFIELTRGLWG